MDTQPEEGATALATCEFENEVGVRNIGRNDEDHQRSNKGLQ